MLKERIKTNKILYSVLKPVVDIMRQIAYSIRGMARKVIIVNPNFRELRKYRNSATEKRCFVVANGPSLTVDDLNKIKNEKCIGMNRIATIFDKTEWRPTCFCVIDEDIIDSAIEIIDDSQPIFTTKSAKNKSKIINQKNFLYVDDLYLSTHKVRTDMLSWWSMAPTVTIFAIELAIFMGYKEIILLGVDNTLTSRKNDHFDDSYDKNDEYKKTHTTLEKRIIERGMTFEEYDVHIKNMVDGFYEKVEKYAVNKGVRIKNATRGGMLEAFERVDLDDLLKD